MNHNPVTAPAHYTVYPVQPIAITRHLGFCLGNAVKYVLRAPYKGGVEDLQKALQYLEWEIEPLHFAGAEEYGYPFKPCFGAYQQITDAIVVLERFMMLPEHGRMYVYPCMFLSALKTYLLGIWSERGGSDRMDALRAFGDMRGAVEEMIREMEFFQK